MEKNVGPLDARLRVGAGIALAILTALSAGGALTLPIVSEVGAAIISAVLIVEGATSRCLLYRLLGIDRCPVE